MVGDSEAGHPTIRIKAQFTISESEDDRISNHFVPHILRRQQQMTESVD